MSDDLPAGPELDRLIAEQVMHDWTDVNAGTHTFKPSTDIAHAWRVVGKLATKNIMAQVTCINRARYEVILAVALDKEKGTWDEVAVEASDTAPLAICRAALKAVS